MKLTNLNPLVFALAFIAANPAQAGLPSMPEIPVTLPDTVREPLIVKRAPLAQQKLALIDAGKAINQQCANVEKGSSKHQDCLARQTRFNVSAETLRTDVDALADEIDAAIEAEKKRLKESEFFYALQTSTLTPMKDGGHPIDAPGSPPLGLRGLVGGTT